MHRPATVDRPTQRVNDATDKAGFRYKRTESRAVFQLNQMVNYVTPGYATAVFVSAGGVARIFAALS